MAESTHARARSQQKSTNVRFDPRLHVARAALHAAEAMGPGAAGWMGRKLFSLPRRRRQPKREVQVLATAKRLKLPTRHGVLRAWSWGRGPTVLLVHGWEGRGAQLGAFAGPIVRAGYRVLAFDGPGHGRSPGIIGAVPELSDAILDIAAQVGDIHGVIAHSMGAVSTTLAIRNGLNLERVAYVAPATAPDKGLEMFQRLLRAQPTTVEATKRKLIDETGVSWFELQHGAVPRGIDRPLLIVHDREDTEVGFESAKRIAARWEGAELVATEGLGHTRILRDADVVRRVADFVTGTSAEDREPSDPWKRMILTDDFGVPSDFDLPPSATLVSSTGSPR